MAEMEKRMLSEMDRFSPETVMKSWMSLVPQNPGVQEVIQQALLNRLPHSPSHSTDSYGRCTRAPTPATDTGPAAIPCYKTLFHKARAIRLTRIMAAASTK
jgi:hypothetical protein